MYGHAEKPLNLFMTIFHHSAHALHFVHHAHHIAALRHVLFHLGQLFLRLIHSAFHFTNIVGLLSAVQYFVDLVDGFHRCLVMFHAIFHHSIRGHVFHRLHLTLLGRGLLLLTRGLAQQ
jgi:hypothetical protein